MNFIKYPFLVLIAIIILMILFPKINFRSMPTGLCNGELPKNMPNWVSSLVPETDEHYIKPFYNTPLPTLAEYIVKCGPKIHITHLDSASLIAYRLSPMLNFTDWICIRADGHVSSSATMGRSDYGKNRELVNKIRTQCH